MSSRIVGLLAPLLHVCRRRIPQAVADRLVADSPWYASAGIVPLAADDACAWPLQPACREQLGAEGSLAASLQTRRTKLGAPCCCCRYCEMNTGSIYNDCDVPQELSDQQIDQIHEEEVRTP